MTTKTIEEKLLGFIESFEKEVEMQAECIDGLNKTVDEVKKRMETYKKVAHKLLTAPVLIDTLDDTELEKAVKEMLKMEGKL